MDKNIQGYVFSKKEPFNLEILKLTNDVIKTLHEVTTIDTFRPSSTEFNEDGLFSTVIFGQVGSKERMSTFGYMDLGLTIIHPLIYNNITTLKSFYKDIIEGKKYAKFDPKLKDFIEAPITEGETGFNFFFKYYDTLKPATTNSKERLAKIKLLKKYTLPEITSNKWLVLPAGLRDYIIKENKHMENEINDYYRNILRIANTAKELAKINVSKDDPIYNAVIIKLTKSVIELYEYILNVLEGKKGFLQDKWAKRGLAYGTRNVLTAIPLNNKKADSPALSFNETLMGLFQLVKGASPISVFNIKNRFLDRVFDETATDTYLINKKTLKLEQAPITDKIKKDWVLVEGLEETMNKLAQDEIKSAPILLDNKYYLYLVMDDGDNIEIYRDISEVEDDKKKYVRPITYMEIFYLSIYDKVKDLHGTITRYPIDSNGSIYVTKFKLKVTMKNRKVKFKPYGGLDYIELDNYPILGDNYFNSMAVHFTKLNGLGADFDGQNYVN